MVTRRSRFGTVLYQMSRWGHMHPVSSRIILIIAGIISGIVCVAAGLLANDIWSLRAAPWLIAGCAIFVPTCILYSTKASFTRRKASDALLKISAILFFFAHGITLGHEAPASVPQVTPVVHHEKSISPKKQLKRIRKSLTKIERKTIRQELRNAVRSMRSSQTGSGDGAGLIILTIFGAIILGMMVAALSCSLACSGSDGAAALVLIGGLFLIILGVIAAVRGIKKRGERLRAARDG